MAGLVPAIHVFGLTRTKTWMPGIKPGMTKLRYDRYLKLRERDP
jgi:hypothetical protein